MRIEKKGTRTTLRPVMNPLLEADVNAKPQVWVRKARKRKSPTTPPFHDRSLEKTPRLAQAKGKRRRQARRKRMNRKLAGVVKGRDSFTMAKELPQKAEIRKRTPSAAHRFE
jgi:hypothetical protein